MVDDDDNIRKVLSAILEDKGYSVQEAGTAREAMRKAEKNYYNMALIDIRLPDMEGIHLLTKIKDTIPRMRKIIITGYPTLQNAVDAVNKGADAYVIKPFEIETVLTTINEQLKKQEQERKLSEDKVAEFIEARVKELDLERDDVHSKKH